MEHPAQDHEDDQRSNGDEHRRLATIAKVAHHVHVTTFLRVVDLRASRRSTWLDSLRHDWRHFDKGESGLVEEGEEVK
jgi:hypothetical protein